MLLGTLLSGMKKQDKWHQYSEGIWFTAKLREAASELGINVKTVWRWQHQLLSHWMMLWEHWLKQFNSAGTAYLDNYTAWFRQMAQPKDEDSWVVLAL